MTGVPIVATGLGVATMPGGDVVADMGQVLTMAGVPILSIRWRALCGDAGVVADG
ncbi:hypothetical protein [Nocardia rhamnosiphila]|uniref:Uncharacterized protein n=1 Tax=Nocardia rhamnosiphila TaxID=426716 RepID=A0ABV2WYT9_9NOCA